jgi:hypothetical protein
VISGKQPMNDFQNVKRKITKTDVEEAQKKSDWDFGNSILYDLCKNHPNHNKTDEIIAKVMLIGRSYSAALERGRKIEDDGSDFYLSMVGPQIKKNRIDSWFKCLSDNLAPGCNKSITIHKKLQNLFATMIDGSKRSLASKYLHFHFPKIFFLYDSRAALTIRLTVPRTLRKACSQKSTGDQIYCCFARSCALLRNHLHDEYGHLLTPRQLDRLLISLADKALKDKRN